MSDRAALINEVRAAIRGGDLLAAYDHAAHALEAHGDSLELRYLSVLSLARAGATGFARKRFVELGLDRTEGEGQLAVDLPALQGRLAKDRALETTGPRRAALFGEAADAYERAFAKTADAYPLVNAAALRLWAGDAVLARGHAEEVLRLLAPAPAERRDYWHFATLAEARLLLGDVAAAGEALAQGVGLAKSADKPDWQALAVTATQLRRSCRHLGVEDSLVAPLRAPPIAVFCGERPSPDMPAKTEADFAAAIRERLRESATAIGFGGLAAGAEILFAEALLDLRGELHLVLALPPEHYVPVAVAPHGRDWVERFERCLRAARRVEYATDYGYEGDAAPLRYAARIAMGQAILRARALDTSAELFSLRWTGGAQAGGGFDPFHDLPPWHRGDRAASLLGADADGTPRWKSLRPAADAAPPIAAKDGKQPDHVNAAILFGDIEGFSKLAEKDMPAYAKAILGTIGDILERHGSSLLARNSWGDAVVAEFGEVDAAARCAVDIQDFFQRLDHAAAGLSGPMMMRIGLHYGPVQRLYDKVQRRDNYMGAHVVRAARIEPVVIPGMIYVSAAFAAALAVASDAGFACDYLGVVNMAKGYGVARLYALRVLDMAAPAPPPIEDAAIIVHQAG